MKLSVTGNSEEQNDFDLFISNLMNLNNNKENLNISSSRLERIINRANEHLTEYKLKNAKLRETINKYIEKKKGLKELASHLSEMRLELKRRDEDLSFREENLENESISFNKEKEKFEKFVTHKSNDLIIKADEIRRRIEDYARLQTLFEKKEEEIISQNSHLDEKERNAKSLLQELEKENCRIEIRRKDFELNKKEFADYSEEIAKKYREITENKITLTDLKSLKEENESKEKYLIQLKENLLSREEEIRKKEDNLIQKEKELNLLKIELEENLTLFKTKSEEIHILSIDLRERENVLKMKSSIDKSLDLKMSELELSDALNKKKAGLRQKMLESLNEEISNKLNKTNLKLPNLNLSSIRTKSNFTQTRINNTTIKTEERSTKEFNI